MALNVYDKRYKAMSPDAQAAARAAGSIMAGINYTPSSNSGSETYTPPEPGENPIVDPSAGSSDFVNGGDHGTGSGEYGVPTTPTQGEITDLYAKNGLNVADYPGGVAYLYSQGNQGMTLDQLEAVLLANVPQNQEDGSTYTPQDQAYEDIPDPTMATDTSALAGVVADDTADAYVGLGDAAVPDYASYDAAGASAQMASNAKNADGTSYVDADKSTVAGQLSMLLASDSPYLEQAAMAGEREAAGRGMLNSSMAAGASQAASIQAALPIAQQDAETYASAQAREQAGNIAQNATQTEGIVSGKLSEQNADIAGTNQRISNQFTAAMQGASESNQVLLQDMQNSHTTFMTELDQQFQTEFQRESLSAQKAETFSVQASTIMQNYQISVETMMTNPEFMDMDSDAVNKALANTQTLAKNSIKFVAASAGLPEMDLAVDAYLKAIEFV